MNHKLLTHQSSPYPPSMPPPIHQTIANIMESAPMPSLPPLEPPGPSGNNSPTNKGDIIADNTMAPSENEPPCQPNATNTETNITEGTSNDIEMGDADEVDIGGDDVENNLSKNEVLTSKKMIFHWLSQLGKNSLIKITNCMKRGMILMVALLLLTNMPREERILMILWRKLLQNCPLKTVMHLSLQHPGLHLLCPHLLLHLYHPTTISLARKLFP